jgi:glycine cleavage system H protein
VKPFKVEDRLLIYRNSRRLKCMVKVGAYEVPEGLYYSKDFEWIKIEGEKVRMGITDYAQKSLREIVYAELPSIGTVVKQGEPYGTLESVKAVSDLVAAVSGIIEEVNDEVQSKPETLNEDPYLKGWLIVVKASNLEAELANLMDFNKAVEWHNAQAQSK